MKQGAPYNPPVGDGLTDRARNLLTGNPLRWAVLHEVRPYSGGERKRRKRRRTAGRLDDFTKRTVNIIHNLNLCKSYGNSKWYFEEAERFGW